jgi:hypothetical protein
MTQQGSCGVMIMIPLFDDDDVDEEEDEWKRNLE